MLTDLKNFLKEQKVNFFLLPNSDEFFSEYLPEDQKRIQYLTGFTGSAATIIVGQERSYFFTDGRYILQAKNELDLKEFEIFNIAQTSVLDWLDENLSTEKKLALDPKLVSINFVKSLQPVILGSKTRGSQEFGVAEGKLTRSSALRVKDDGGEGGVVFFDSNPVDKIWKNRPLSKKSPIFFCDKKLTGADSMTKRRLVLQGLEADGVIISSPENICWLLNIRAADVEFTPLLLAYAILFKSGEVDLFVDAGRILDQKNPDLEKVNFISVDHFNSRIATLRKSFSKIQIDASSTNYWLYELLQKNNFEIINKVDAIEIAKACKSEAEISGAIKSHEVDGIAVTKFLFWLEKSLKNGEEIDEIKAAEKLLEFRAQHPAFLYPSFASISGFASNGAVIHYHATTKTNKKFVHSRPSNKCGVTMDEDSPFVTPHLLRGLEFTDSLYLIDSGGQYFGEDFCGTTDVTRTVAIGTPSAEMVENFTRVLKGHIALARVKFPRGTSGAQLDVLAREHLWNAGLDYDHGTGHGVGSFLSVHEGPAGISKRAHQPLLEGMILSNEPGFYKPNEYGIRIENLMLVEKCLEKNNKEFLQFRTLTLVPLDPNLIDFKMLTHPEKKWLRNYHQKILEKFSEKLNQENLFYSQINSTPRNESQMFWLQNICEKFL